MDVFELFAVLKLNADEYKKGLSDAKDEATKGGGGIGNALGKAAKVGAVALTAATTAAIAFGKSSVEAGMTFDSSMSQVAATMGDNAQKMVEYNGQTMTSIDALREYAQEMGRTTAFSASESADALNYMALAGYDAETSMKMLPNVLNLAAAGGMDLARASDMVTDTQSALNLSLDETNVMVDQMAKTASTTNTSVEQLGDAMLTIGATARGVKGGTAELSTVLGILADNGIKGAEGGTHLRNAILSLQTPTKDGTEALAKMGMTYADMYDEAGNLRSLPEIFQQMSTAMEGMTQQSKDAIISGIFNKTDLAAINALIGTDADRWDEVTVAIEGAKGAAEQMAATQLDNLSGDITLFQSALEGAKIAVSDVLTPSLREFVQFGTESLSQLTAAFKEDGLAGAMEALGDIIQQGIGMLFEALPQAFDAGLTLLEAVIGGILDNLPILIEAAINLVSTLSEDIVQNLPKLIDATIEIVLAIADGIIDALPQLIPAIVQTITTIVTKLTEPSTMTRLIQAAFEIIGALARGILQAIPTLIAAIPQVISNLIQSIKSFFGEFNTEGFEIVGELAAGILSGVFQVVGSIFSLGNDIVSAFGDIISSAWAWGADLIGNFISGIGAKAGDLWNSVSNVAQGVRNFLGFSEPKEGPLSNFHTYAPDMMMLFAKGIEDNKDMLLDTVADAFDFGSVTIDSASNMNASTGFGIQDQTPIIVQSILDGKIISETVTKYQRREARAYG